MADEYRVFNFSAGPSVLPEPVLRKCAAEMLNYEGTGESVMEMSHRSPEFQKIIDDAEANLRKLMFIPDDYYVMFLQGGATLQFSMVPINLLTTYTSATTTPYSELTTTSSLTSAITCS